MTCSEKLKDPRWQKKRLEILNRDEFTCQYCGAKDKTLHVHHYGYRKGKEPWDVDGGDVNTLCEDCHWLNHTKLKVLNISAQEIFDELVSFAHLHSDAQTVLRVVNDLIRKKNG
jgi:hypothetical protein